MKKRIAALGFLIALLAGSRALAADAEPQMFTDKISLVHVRPAKIMSVFTVPETATPDPKAAPPAGKKLLLPKGIVAMIPFDMDNSVIVKGTESAIKQFKTSIRDLDLPPTTVTVDHKLWLVEPELASELLPKGLRSLADYTTQESLAKFRAYMIGQPRLPIGENTPFVSQDTLVEFSSNAWMLSSGKAPSDAKDNASAHVTFTPHLFRDGRITAKLKVVFSGSCNSTISYTRYIKNGEPFIAGGARLDSGGYAVLIICARAYPPTSDPAKTDH